MANSGEAQFSWDITKAISVLGLTSLSDGRSGTPHDPEKQRLAEIIDRIERNEAVMAQVRSHSEDQVMQGLLPNKVTDAVLDALSDHEKLYMPPLEDEKGEQFTLLILKLSAGRGGRNEYIKKQRIDYSVGNIIFHNVYINISTHMLVNHLGLFAGESQ